MPLVCIDPGHGGVPGAVSAAGLREADLALAISIKLSWQLSILGVDGFLTRTTDENILLSKRSEMAKEEGADCFVSVHLNSFSSPQAEGFETIYAMGQPQSKSLANQVHAGLAKGLGGHKNRGMKMAPSNLYPRNLYVLRMAPCPAVLVEPEFLSHLKWGPWLATDSAQETIAFFLAQGIYSWLREKDKSLPPIA